MHSIYTWGNCLDASLNEIREDECKLNLNRRLNYWPSNELIIRGERGWLRTIGRKCFQVSKFDANFKIGTRVKH
jgi:hypothetical protein